MLRLLSKISNHNLINRPLVNSLNCANLTSDVGKPENIGEKVTDLNQSISSSSSLPGQLGSTKTSSSGITVIEEPGRDWCTLAGIPSEHLYHRRVRIFKPSKNAMQSGTHNTHHWLLGKLLTIFPIDSFTDYYS